jgi:hypothetical protein
MTFWLIVSFIGGAVFGFELVNIAFKSRFKELKSENEKLKLKLSASEEAIRVLRENQKYTTYDSNGQLKEYNT